MADRGRFVDGVLLAVGTLTALRVPPPSAVDRSRAGVAASVAPVAILPLALLVGATGWAAGELELNPWAVGFALVGLLALGSRALHLDGLSDVADALTSGHARDRALTVMKDSSAGPAGAAALVLTLSIQSASMGHLLTVPHGAWLVAAVVCASRAALPLCCARGVRAAREDGLGVGFAQSVPPLAAVAVWVAVAATVSVVANRAGLDWWIGAIAVGAGLVTAAVVLWRCVSRLGGITGDVFGAAIELALAAMLLAATAAT